MEIKSATLQSALATMLCVVLPNLQKETNLHSLLFDPKQYNYETNSTRNENFNSKITNQNIYYYMGDEFVSYCNTYRNILKYYDFEMDDNDTVLENMSIIRNYKDYDSVFKYITSEVDNRMIVSLINILSLYNHRNILGCEENFIISQLLSDNNIIQDRALRTVNLWNNKNMILKLQNITMKNRFLQARLDKIINRVKDC